MNFFFGLSPFTTWPIRYLCGRLVFLIFPTCGAAGLRGTFPGYPRPPSPFSFFWTTQHEYNNIQHPWEAHPAWDSNHADLAVVSEECRSSFHHPTVYTHIHGPAEVPYFEKILPLRWDRTHYSARTATSEHCLRQPLRPPSYIT
jgi:hypothetical protein